MDNKKIFEKWVAQYYVENGKIPSLMEVIDKAEELGIEDLMFDV